MNGLLRGSGRQQARLGGEFRGWGDSLWRVRVVTSADSPYTPAYPDLILLCNATAGAITIALPASATHANWSVTAKKTDASANAVTFDGAGAETIDGAATLALNAQNKAATTVCDGAAWYAIGVYP